MTSFNFNVKTVVDIPSEHGIELEGNGGLGHVIGIVTVIMLEHNEEYAKAIPMQRFGTPEDIAKVVKFLALDTEYVTGQAIEVAGGLML